VKGVGSRGSASIEFVVVAMAVFVPILALTVSVSSIQSAQFAVAAVARQGVRAVALSPTLARGNNRVSAINKLVREDFGVDTKSTWKLTCSANPCLTRGGLVRLTVSANVPIAMVPALPGLTLPPSVRVSSTATHVIPVAAGR